MTDRWTPDAEPAPEPEPIEVDPGNEPIQSEPIQADADREPLDDASDEPEFDLVADAQPTSVEGFEGVEAAADAAIATTSDRPPLDQEVAAAAGVAADEAPGGEEATVPVEPWEQPVERIDVAEADRIDISRGSVGRAMADTLEVRQGAVGGVQASEVRVSMGAVGGARANYVSVERGVVGGALAGQLNVHQGYVQSVIAREARFEQGGARTIVANKVTLGPQSGAFLVIARTVDGPGRILVDWRAGVALGVILGAVMVLLRVRRR
jgi:hypothetical protein